MKKIFLSLWLVAGLAGCGVSDFDKGVKAYKNDDFKYANSYFKKACDSGHAKGCYMLASSYYEGKGVKQDYSKAKTYYDRWFSSGMFQSWCFICQWERCKARLL